MSGWMDGLRERRPGGESKSAGYSGPAPSAPPLNTIDEPSVSTVSHGRHVGMGSTIDRQETERLEKLLHGMAGKSPPWLANLLVTLKPVILGLFQFGLIASPFITTAYKWAIETYKILPKNALALIWGLAYCFFGGFFSVSIAAVEAFSHTGGDRVKLCLDDLMEDLKLMKEASDADDKRDDDNDGVPDVNQVSASQLATRKTLLALRTINPDRVTGALTGLVQGYMGVLVVLKFQFARTITLAVSIADMLRPLAARFFAPALMVVIPPDYQQWIMPMLNYGCKFVAMSIAWWLQRIISTVQSAIKGGLMFARALLRLLHEQKYIAVTPDDTYLDEMVGWGMAVLGFYFQVSMNWNLPIYVDVVLFPMHVLEWFLKWSITWMDTTGVPMKA